MTQKTADIEADGQTAHEDGDGWVKIIVNRQSSLKAVCVETLKLCRMVARRASHTYSVTLADRVTDGAVIDGRQCALRLCGWPIL